MIFEDKKCFFLPFVAIFELLGIKDPPSPYTYELHFMDSIPRGHRMGRPMGREPRHGTAMGRPNEHEKHGSPPTSLRVVPEFVLWAKHHLMGFSVGRSVGHPMGRKPCHGMAMGRLNEQHMGTWLPIDQPTDRPRGRPMGTISSHGTIHRKSYGSISSHGVSHGSMGIPILYPMGRKPCHGTAHGLAAHGTNHDGTHGGS